MDVIRATIFMTRKGHSCEQKTNKSMKRERWYYKSDPLLNGIISQILSCNIAEINRF